MRGGGGTTPPMTDADLAAQRLRRIVRTADAAMRDLARRERLVRRVAMGVA